MKRQCRRCAYVYEGADMIRVMFTTTSRGLHARRPPHLRSICNPCLQTDRDARKARDRFADKARSTIRLHARRFGMASKDFSARYGWNVKDIAHQMRHDFENGCKYCLRPYASMPGGLSSLTLDVIDPRRQPYYLTNTVITCMTCNREKSDLPPEDYELKRLGWRQWEAAAKPEQKGFGW